MSEPVIVQKNIKDKIQFEEKYDFTTYLTIGLAEDGDFYLIIDFLNLTINDLKLLIQLSQLSRPLSIKSQFMDKEEYKITHVVITKLSTSNNLTMTWECISDDPSLDDDLFMEEN